MTTQNIKAIAKLAFPEYRGRKFRLVSQAHYQMADYWDEGSRRYAVAVNLNAGTPHAPSIAAHTPWSSAAQAKFTIPDGVAIVERAIFCGKDCGITVYIAQALHLQEVA